MPIFYGPADPMIHSHASLILEKFPSRRSCHKDLLGFLESGFNGHHAARHFKSS